MPSEIERIAACPDCAGDGWVVGLAVQTREGCCGGSDWECGGRGCTGPIPIQEQVQIQECCEACWGTGNQPSTGAIQMSEDWFEFAQLADGRAFVQGRNAQDELIVLELGEEEVASVEALEARHHAAMQRLLRDLATLREPKP